MKNSINILNLSRLLAGVYEAACKHSINYFQHWVFLYLQNHIEFDSAIWSINNTNDKLHSSHIAFNIPENFIENLERAKANDILIREMSLNPGRTLNSIDINSLPNMPYNSELYYKYSIAHTLATLIPEERLKTFHAFLISRSEKNNFFSERERQLIQAIIPHIIQAWRINCHFFLNISAIKEVSNQPCKVALVDYQGGIQQAIEGFSNILKQEWKSFNGYKLPSELIERLIRNRTKIFKGNYISVTATYFQYLVLLQVRELSPLETLTPRERQVAISYSQGKSYKEIAKELSVAPSTVRNHLQNIYSNLKINSKAQLAQLL